MLDREMHLLNQLRVIRRNTDRDIRRVGNRSLVTEQGDDRQAFPLRGVHARNNVA